MQPIHCENGSGLEEAECCNLLSLLTYSKAVLSGSGTRPNRTFGTHVFCVYSDDSSITVYGTAQGNRIPWEIEIWGTVEVWSFYTKEVICNWGLARIKPAICLMPIFLRLDCLELFIHETLQSSWLYYHTHLFGVGNVLISLICPKSETAPKCYD